MKAISKWVLNTVSLISLALVVLAGSLFVRVTNKEGVKEAKSGALQDVRTLGLGTDHAKADALVVGPGGSDGGDGGCGDSGGGSDC